jgi:hypothetical protein
MGYFLVPGYLFCAVLSCMVYVAQMVVFEQEGYFWSLEWYFVGIGR